MILHREGIHLNMRRMKIIFAVAVLGAFRILAGNHVVNPGFEIDAGKGGAANWSSAKKPFSYVSGEGRNGTRALRFDFAKNSPYVFPSQKLKLVPGESYVAEAWVRTENLNGENGIGAALAAEWCKPDGTWYSGRYSHPVSGNVGEFTKITVRFTLPKDAGICTISPYVMKGCTGKAWFDDLAIVKAERPLVGPMLVSDAYRNTAVSGDVKLSVNVFMTEKDRAEKGFKAEFELPLAEGVRFIEAPIRNEVVQTVVDAGALFPGRSRFVFRLKDGSGKVLAERELAFLDPNQQRAIRVWPRCRPGLCVLSENVRLWTASRSSRSEFSYLGSMPLQ